MNELRDLFNPTKEKRISQYESLIQLHKEQFGECSTCRHYDPPSSDLPGFVIDYGKCKRKIDIFYIKVCGPNKVGCVTYEEDADFVKELEGAIEQLKKGE